MSLTDHGITLFPSMTVCKDQMLRTWDRGLVTRVVSGELSVEEARGMFREEISSRAELVKLLSVKTVEGSNSYPCTTVSGPRSLYSVAKAALEIASVGCCSHAQRQSVTHRVKCISDREIFNFRKTKSVSVGKGSPAPSPTRTRTAASLSGPPSVRPSLSLQPVSSPARRHFTPPELEIDIKSLLNL